MSPRRQRDYRAEYRARVERATQLGISRAQARGHPGAGERRISELRQAGILPPSRPKRRLVPPKITPTPAGDLIVSMDARFLVAQLRRAAGEGKRAAILVTFTDRRTDVPMSRYIDGRDYQYPAQTDDERPVSKPQLVLGDRLVTRGGIDPARFLDFVGEMGGLWPALRRAWEEGQSSQWA